MKKIAILFYLLFSIYSNFAFAENNYGSAIQKDDKNCIGLYQKPCSNPFDSSLFHLEIYDPSARNYFYGLGFPGAATRSIAFLLPDSIGIFPQFNSYQTLFLSDNLVQTAAHKPQTQVQYVIFPSLKTEQYLDLVHSRNINERNSLGFQIRKIKSNGYFLQQGSNVTNLRLAFNAKSKNLRYGLQSELFYNGIVSIENGGLQNDSIEYNSRSIALQSLPIQLEDAKNRFKYFGGKITQSFYLGNFDTTRIDSSTVIRNFHPTSSFNLGVNYSRNSFTYLDNNPLDGYYQLVYQDSNDTFDKSVFDQFCLDFNYATPANKSSIHKLPIGSKVGIRNELSYLERKDITKQFQNTSAYASLFTSPTSIIRFGAEANYFFHGYNADNLNASLLAGAKFLDSTKYTFAVDLFLRYQQMNTAFVLQNYRSNHFSWRNEFEEQKVKTIGIHISTPKSQLLQFSYSSLEHYVFLDSNSLPTQMGNKFEWLNASFEKLFQLKSFYFNAKLNYQKVLRGEDRLGLPEFFTRSSIYWSDEIFKHALLLQIGFDFTYASKFNGLAYQPALNSFYYQNKKSNGNYPAVDFFINFKIRQARMFFKVDHLNYGLSGGSYSYVPGYLLPGRTFRFGISWLFIN